MIERWEPVPGYEGLYEVSDHGRVRSLDRLQDARNRYGAMTRLLKGGIIKPSAHRDWGHQRVGLRRNGKKQRFMVHRLVGLVFLPPAPPEKPLVLHRDGNPANNHVSNLYWGDNKENSQDAVAHGTIVRGEQSTHAKLTEKQVLDIREKHGRGATYRGLARQYGVTHRAIRLCVLRESWTHI
jgi:hypothetical protein